MAGRHIAPQETERTLTLVILAVGTVAALGSLFGGIWLVRAGVVVAVAMAIAAVVIGFTQLERERREHAAEVKRQVSLRRAQSEKHHADSVAMMDRFNERTTNLGSVIDSLRRQLAAANGELSSMRGNTVWLRGEVAERQARIDALTARIAELEAAQDDDAEVSKVVSLPRHATAGPVVEDIWGSDEHPTMVDLAKLQLDLPVAELRKQA